MFSLIHAILTAYMMSKGYKLSNYGCLVAMVIIADLAALTIVFR